MSSEQREVRDKLAAMSLKDLYAAMSEDDFPRGEVNREISLREMRAAGMLPGDAGQQSGDPVMPDASSDGKGTGR